jgi:arylsulfatase A-like enzyme
MADRDSSTRPRESRRSVPSAENVAGDAVCGSLLGARAWIAYGAVETWFLVVQPWLLDPRYAYRPRHVGFLLACIGLYAIIGALLGLLAALCLRFGRKRLAWLNRSTSTGCYVIAGSVSVVLAAALSAFMLSADARHVSYSLSAIILAVLIVTVGITGRTTRVRFLLSPWLPPFLLIYPAWAQGKFGSSVSSVALLRICFALTAALIIISVGWMIHTIGQHVYRARNRPLQSPLKSAALAFSLATTLCVTAHFLRPQLIIRQTTFASAPRPMPNVVLLCLDTVRADHLSVYGYGRDTTPNLRAFARGATLYTQAFSASDYTLPSHASIFTGTYASRHGARFWSGYGYDMPLSPHARPLAEILLEGGFSTAGIVANYGFLSHRYGMDRGFDYYDERPPVLMFVDFPIYCLREGLVQIIDWLHGLSELDRDYRRAEDINTSVLPLLNERPFTSRPFFLFCNYMDAHTPYLPPGSFARLFADAGSASAGAHEHGSATHQRVDARQASEAEKRRDLISRYDGAIAYLDSQLGNVFAELRNRRLYDNSLIIVTSDHGEAFGERGHWGHPWSVYQDQIHVPLIVKYPGQTRGVVFDEAVSGVDVLPAVLDVLGQQPLPGLEGQSLLRLSKGVSVLAEHFTDRQSGFRSRGDNEIARAIMAGHVKLVLLPNGRREVFDLSADPNEEHNLYNPTDPAQRQLEGRLLQWIDSVGKLGLQGPAPDREAIERLRSLGYVR